jgi:hypothetical protein
VERAISKEHAKFARSAVSKICSVMDSKTGQTVFDFTTDKKELVFVDQPIQRPLDPARVASLSASFLEDSSKDIMIGQVICIHKGLTPEEVLKDLLRKDRVYQYAITGGQHTVRSIRDISKSDPYADSEPSDTEKVQIEKFFADRPKLRKFQAKVYTMGHLKEFNRLFSVGMKASPPTVEYDNLKKIRHFQPDSDPFVIWEKSGEKGKHFIMTTLTVEEKLHLPELNAAMMQLRIEHNAMGTSSEASWLQKLENARLVWTKTKQTTDPGTDATVQLKQEFDYFTSSLKSELAVQSVQSALKYKNILSLEASSWESLVVILEKDSELKLLDHQPIRTGEFTFKKGAKKPVFNIQSLLLLCSIDSKTTPDRDVEIQSVLQSIANGKIKFVTIKAQVDLIKVLLLQIFRLHSDSLNIV